MAGYQIIVSFFFYMIDYLWKDFHCIVWQHVFVFLLYCIEIYIWMKVYWYSTAGSSKCNIWQILLCNFVVALKDTKKKMLVILKLIRDWIFWKKLSTTAVKFMWKIFTNFYSIRFYVCYSLLLACLSSIFMYCVETISVWVL